MAGYKQGGMTYKYIVKKRSGKRKDRNAKYFVLRYDADPHARVAMAAYADSVESVNHALANDMRLSIRKYNRAAAVTEGAKNENNKFDC